jgi:hypothetical protein
MKSSTYEELDKAMLEWFTQGGAQEKPVATITGAKKAFKRSPQKVAEDYH